VNLPRRQFLHLAAGAAVFTTVSHIARAQAYPTRPVRIIVPFAPGGSTDIVTRLVAQRLSERLGQQFIVENRPGGGSNTGTEAAVNAPADGYTLIMLGNANAINASLYQKLNFNLIRDIAPLAGINTQANVMVHPSEPIMAAVSSEMFFGSIGRRGLRGASSPAQSARSWGPKLVSIPRCGNRKCLMLPVPGTVA